MEKREPTIEERMTLIEQRHADLAQHVTILSEMQERAEKRMEEWQEQRAKRDDKIDRRISRLFSITLRIGADFAERLRKLEQGESEGESEA